MLQWLMFLVCAIALSACGDGSSPPTPDDGGQDGGDGSGQDVGTPDGGDDGGTDGGTDGDVDGGGDGGVGLGPLPPHPANEVGPYPIGVTTVELVDLERSGRPLPVEVWYPAIHDAGYFTERYDLEAGGLRLAIIDSPNGAVRDARVDGSAGPRPFVVFSHGNGGVRLQSIFLTEYLASHGFVVAALDHTGNTLGDFMFGTGDYDTGQAALDRPVDVSFVIDELVERTDEVLPLLSGLIDAERIGVTGHSFGGYTSLAVAGAALNLAWGRQYCADNPNESACDIVNSFDPVLDFISFADDRVRAAVPLAPGGYVLIGDEGVGMVGIPTFVQGGDLDETTPLAAEQETVFAALPPPAWLAVIEGAGHFTFSDICTLVEIYGEEIFAEVGANVLTDGCGDENIDVAVAHPIINRLTTAFFQLHLQDHQDASDLLVSGDHVEVRTR